MQTTPWHARLALILALLLPVYFAAAALGTKFGLWGWQTGLLTLTITTGPIVIGVVALIALISLVIVVWRKPRSGWKAALIALLVPAAIIGTLGYIRSQAAEIPPIHDVATDLSDPPGFSAGVLAARQAVGANPINDYRVPVGELDPWRERVPELAQLSHAEIIAKSYPGLEPLPLGGASPAQGVEAVAAAMREMGLHDIATDPAAGRVEGVAETFWFGFKDDMVARVSDGRIDFRSVSRVGLSDLGANAARIGKLRAEVARQLSR